MPAPEPPQSAPSYDVRKRIEQVKNLEQYRSTCVALLLWISANEEKLNGLEWDACHIYGRINITVGGYNKIDCEQDPHTIIKRWPGRVWTRVKNGSTCGLCDWSSTPENDLPIIITGAEKMRWIPAPDTVVKARPHER